MSTEVKRYYSPIGTMYEGGKVTGEPAGDYVRYDDYIALKEERDRLRTALEDITHDGPISETPTIEAIVNRLQRIARAALA